MYLVCANISGHLCLGLWSLRHLGIVQGTILVFPHLCTSGCSCGLRLGRPSAALGSAVNSCMRRSLCNSVFMLPDRLCHNCSSRPTKKREALPQHTWVPLCCQEAGGRAALGLRCLCSLPAVVLLQLGEMRQAGRQPASVVLGEEPGSRRGSWRAQREWGPNFSSVAASWSDRRVESSTFPSGTAPCRRWITCRGMICIRMHHHGSWAALPSRALPVLPCTRSLWLTKLSGRRGELMLGSIMGFGADLSAGPLRPWERTVLGTCTG